ncbi:MAG: DUF1273 domain-containing protein [Defluviitaleaceae bacterium]|nr:DUF1273 domain-containing protein [Defluviitaleaceae bacterium]
MVDNKNKTACFTGHRIFSQKRVETIEKRLHEEIDRLIQHGITDFISGGALGFGHMTATLVLSKKHQGADIRLILALPCRDQDKDWTDMQKYMYHIFLAEADEVHYVSKKYTPDCMKKRNFYMVDNSAFCICALLRDISGTGQTVRYAQQQGLQVINIAKQLLVK